MTATAPCPAHAQAGSLGAPKAGQKVMETKSGSQAKREGLYAEGLCRDCEAQLLDEELEADARRCVPGGGRAAQGEEAGQPSV